jgi:hypothetical protein
MDNYRIRLTSNGKDRHSYGLFTINSARVAGRMLLDLLADNPSIESIWIERNAHDTGWTIVERVK